MRLFTVIVQGILLAAVLSGVQVPITTGVQIYVIDFLLISLCLRATLKRGNWFIDQSFVIMVVYFLYYPLTALTIAQTGLAGSESVFLTTQVQFSLLFISGFSLAYISLLRPDAPLIDRDAALFSKGYSNLLLVPLIFMLPLMKIAMLWATAGFHFQYTDLYLASFKLKDAGLNIINQIYNAGFPDVALAIFFIKEISARRYGRCVALLAGFFALSLYLGARTTFMAPLLTFVVVLSRFEKLKLGARTLAGLGLAGAYFFVAEALRSTGPGVTDPGGTAFLAIGEAFTVVANGFLFFGHAALEGPPVNTYLNDFSSFLPKYIHSTGFDTSRWLMLTHFPDAYAAGAGRAFGFNTEALIHSGARSAAFQAISLGVGFGTITRLRPRSKLAIEYWTVLRVVLIAYGYVAIRQTTFSWVPLLGSTLVGFIVIRGSDLILSAAVAPASAVPALQEIDRVPIPG